MSFYKLYSLKKYKTYEISKDNSKKILEVALNKKEISKYEQSTRSTLIAWDSFFQEIKRIKGNYSLSREDLVSKSIAARIHEQLGSRRDLEIALQLYKDSIAIFFSTTKA